MAERRIINGWIVERQPDGSLRTIGPAGGSQDTGAGPVVTPLPRHPDEVARERRESARSDRGEQREDTRIGLSQEDNARNRTNDRFNHVDTLAGRYNQEPTTKAYREAIQQLSFAIKTTPDPQGDLALTYAFAKAMDPESVVREAEQGMVTESQPWFQARVEQVRKQFGMDGAGSYAPKTRDALRQQIISSVAQRNKLYNARRDYYAKVAEANGLNPFQVIGDHDGAPFFPGLQEYDQRKKGMSADAEQEYIRLINDQSVPPEKVLEFARANGFQFDPAQLVKSREAVRQNPQQIGVNYPAQSDIEVNPNSYQDSYLGQGMSGVNEGIASVLGAPVDLMTLGMNAGVSGINTLTNGNIPRIERPFLGSEQIGDQMRDWGMTYGPSRDPRKQFVRRTGQSFGATAVPLAGAPTTLGRVGAGLAIGTGGGMGAATAQQVFPNNPAAEFAGEVLGSGLSAGALARQARKRAVRKTIEAVPSRDELRDQASNLYNIAESRGIVAGPNVTGNLAGRFGKIADDEAMRWPNGKVDPNYARAGANLDMMDAFNGQSIDPRQIQVMRENLMDAVRGTQGKERRIAQQMLDAFDEETIPLAPELADARRTASRYLQSDEIQVARDLASARASQYSNSGAENALRTEFRKLDRDIIGGKRRFNPDTADAINRVARGTPYSNTMRTIGKAAPTGVVSAGFSAGVPFMVGNALGGPGLGTAMSLGSLGAGTAARKAATKEIEFYADLADATARNGGALNVPPVLDDKTQEMLRRAALGLSSQYIPPPRKKKKER